MFQVPVSICMEHFTLGLEGPLLPLHGLPVQQEYRNE